MYNVSMPALPSLPFLAGCHLMERRGGPVTLPYGAPRSLPHGVHRVLPHGVHRSSRADASAVVACMTAFYRV